METRLSRVAKRSESWRGWRTRGNGIGLQYTCLCLLPFAIQDNNVLCNIRASSKQLRYHDKLPELVKGTRAPRSLIPKKVDWCYGTLGPRLTSVTHNCMLKIAPWREKWNDQLEEIAVIHPNFGDVKIVKNFTCIKRCKHHLNLFDAARLSRGLVFFVTSICTSEGNGTNLRGPITRYYKFAFVFFC